MTDVAHQLRTSLDPDALVRVRRARKVYGALEVLKGIDLDVRTGETLCIVGASGSGKSTLLRTINGLVPLTEGTVVVGEERVGYERRGDHLVTWKSRAALKFRSGIGLVSQSVNFFPNRTALENAAEGLIHVLGTPKREARAAALESLEAVGLGAKAARDPSELSGGEQQRVAIARALDPSLVGEVFAVMRR